MPSKRRHRHPRRTVIAGLLVLLGLCAAPLNAGARGTVGGGKVFLTVAEAIELAFPKAEVERLSVYFTKEEKKRVSKLATFEVAKAISRPYVARKNGIVVGTAYFDNHGVRALKETLMIVVDPKGTIVRVEVLAFAEPREYLPRASWYAQFKGKRLNAKLSLKGDIKGVTGATLTARATTKAARRILAQHMVWKERPVAK